MACGAAIRRWSVTLSAWLAVPLVAACEAPRPPPAPANPTSDPGWQDVFDHVPQLLASIRPQALRRDPIYGPLLRRALDLARARNRVVAATHALDAVEDAEQVIVALDDEPGVALDQAALVAVILGVRADIDPATLVDANGHALWEPGPSGRVRELVREQDDDGEPVQASLFELPGRTWVIASGGARARAREAFGHPRRRPLRIDPDALALVRIDGPALVARMPILREPAAFAQVGSKMSDLTLELAPGGVGALEGSLSYSDDRAATAAEQTLREALAAMARRKTPPFAWLCKATVGHTPGTGRVLVSAPLPRSLLGALRELGGGVRPSASANAEDPCAGVAPDAPEGTSDHNVGSPPAPL